MGIKQFEVVKRNSHADKQWSPDEIRVWHMSKVFWTPNAPLIPPCHTLISSGDLCLMTCDFCLVLVRCLVPIIRQFVKFRDMPENKRKYWCTIRKVPRHTENQMEASLHNYWGSVTFHKSKRGWLCKPQGFITLRKENKYRYKIHKFP